jgi:hypothetical protein
VLNHPARSPLSRTGGIKTGCLVIFLVFLALIVGGGAYVYMNWRTWAAAGANAITERAVADSGLPQKERDQILAQVRSLSDDFKNNKISLEQMSQVGQEIVQGPIIPLAAVQAARQKYIEPSDMTAEEKAAANRSLQRFARGVYEKKISKETIDDTIKPITTLKPDGRWELKAKPTRQELDQFVANAKARADEAKIPDEPFDLDISAELKKAIDKALGRTPTGK